MPQEIEVKFPLRDRTGIIARLEAASARLLYAETFEDNIILDRRGELRTRGAMLRVRKFGRYTIMTFKGPTSIEGGIRSREEIQTGIESVERALALFEALGYKPVFRYQKYREVWRVRELEVVLDRTPIGDFFEIEGPAEDIKALVAEMELDMDLSIRSSYADLYRQFRRTRPDLPEHMVFPAQDLPG